MENDSKKVKFFSKQNLETPLYTAVDQKRTKCNIPLTDETPMIVSSGVFCEIPGTVHPWKTGVQWRQAMVVSMLKDKRLEGGVLSMGRREGTQTTLCTSSKFLDSMEGSQEKDEHNCRLF